MRVTSVLAFCLLMLSACGTTETSNETLKDIIENDANYEEKKVEEMNKNETEITKEDKSNPKKLNKKEHDQSNNESSTKAQESEKENSIDNDTTRETTDNTKLTQHTSIKIQEEKSDASMSEEDTTSKEEKIEDTTKKDNNNKTTEKEAETSDESSSKEKDEQSNVTPKPNSEKADNITIKEATGTSTTIIWDEFFDSEAQNEPSQKFENLSGKKVELVGYMGEALDFKGGWFLMIETADGECPFCSVDESYWNKVMVVYVKNKNYLRYLPGKVKVTGTLDVGIKKDESGYKTMFRLYHAEFKSVK